LHYPWQGRGKGRGLGMWGSLGIWMIGRWVLWWIFFIFWSTIPLQVIMETNWDGLWRRMGALTFACATMLYKVPPLSFFFGKAFGKWRTIGEFSVLFGLRLIKRRVGIRYSLVTIWRVMGLLLLIGVACVIVGRPLIHCEKAHQLWCSIFRSFGVSWVLPKTVLDLLFGWGNIRKTFGT